MNKGILLVEDNADDIMFTQRVIQMHSAHEVITVRDGAESLDFLFGTGSYEGRDTTVSPLLVLLDLKLPKMDGFEVLRRIRQDDRTRSIPVIILSASDEKKDIADSYTLGANSYIRKQVDRSRSREDIKLAMTYWLGVSTLPV